MRTLPGVHEEHRCQRCLGVSAGTARLWDGRDYCTACLQSAGNDLLEMALRGEALRDVLEPAREYGWPRLMWPTAVALVVGLTLSAGGCPLGVLVALCALCVLLVPVHERFSRAVSPGVREILIEGGEVRWACRNKKRTLQARAPLQDFVWRFGTRKEDSFAGKQAGQEPCIILIRTWRVLGFPTLQVRLACGGTRERVAQLAAFLEFVKLPCAEPRVFQRRATHIPPQPHDTPS